MKVRALLVLGLCLIPVLGFAQVMPSGNNFTPGHAVRAMNSQGTVVGDAGGAAGSSQPGQGYLTELGITAPGAPLCVNDALISGAYHQLCMGANSLGGGLLSYNALGGATALPLQFNVNGTNYQFPFTNNGMLGPASTTVSEVVCFNNTVGTLSKDCATAPPAGIVGSNVSASTVDIAGLNVSPSGTGAQGLFNQAVASGSATLFQSNDALRGVALAPALSTVNTITGVAGYTLNNTVPIGQRSQTASLFGIGVCAVNSSTCWGVDTITSDNPTPLNTGITAGTGKFLYNEFDLEITSPNTLGGGLVIGGTALPTSTTLGVNAIAVNKLWGAGGAGTGTALFSNGLIITDACCGIGISIGSVALSGATQNSQPLYMNYRSATNVYENAQFQVVPSGSGTSGTVFLNGTGSAMNFDIVNGGLFLPANQAVYSNNNIVLFSDGSTTNNLGLNAPFTALALGNSSTTVTVSGTVVAPNLPTQAHAGSNACLGYNATTHAIYISSTITTC